MPPDLLPASATVAPICIISDFFSRTPQLSTLPHFNQATTFTIAQTLSSDPSVALKTEQPMPVLPPPTHLYRSRLFGTSPGSIRNIQSFRGGCVMEVGIHGNGTPVSDLVRSRCQLILRPSWLGFGGSFGKSHHCLTGLPISLFSASTVCNYSCWRLESGSDISLLKPRLECSTFNTRNDPRICFID